MSATSNDAGCLQRKTQRPFWPLCRFVSSQITFLQMALEFKLRKITILSMPSTRAPPLSPSRSVSPTSTHHFNLLNCSQDRYLSIKGRLYPASGPKPKLVVIKTHCASGSRFPSTEMVFTGINVEPGVHDTIVTVMVQGQDLKFLVLCKSSTHLPVNQMITTSDPDANWHGDLLIMRIGSRAGGVVNWRGCENYIATRIVSE
jgi:hypothetical protein